MTTDAAATVDRYSNLEEFELEHGKLLDELDLACASENVPSDSDSERAFVEANLERITRFIERGARTGAILHGLAERRPAQQILDRWAACLFRVGIRNGPHATLAPFDENAAPQLTEEDRPYVGLEPFNEGEKTLFRGRDDRIADLTEAVRTRTFVFVTGASGSGKSSLVLAGLVPALRSDAENGTDNWTILPTVVPGATPLRNLARQLCATFAPLDEKRLYGELCADPMRLRAVLDEHVAGTCLMVIDQFEEVFTLRSGSRENDSPAFIAALVALAKTPGCRHRIVATFRKDREGDLAAYADLQQIYFDRPFIVTSMRPDQLREAIEKPAAQAGLIIESDVVDALVNTFSGDETGLPLLQYCLVELWQRRTRNRVTARTLRELGDPKHAMAQVADEIYKSLAVQGQAAVKLIFLALSQKIEGQEFLRTRKTRAELWSIVGNKLTADDVIARLAERRLLKISPAAERRAEDDTIEVAHEALLRNWTEFRKWVVESGARIDQRMFISRQAALWADSAGKEAESGQQDATGLLLSGIALSQAMTDIYADFPENSVERRFLDASEKKARWVEGELARAADAARKEADWEREKARRAKRREHFIRGAIGLVLLGAVGFVLVEWRSNADFRTQNVAAAALEKCETEPDLARRLALRAFEGGLWPVATAKKADAVAAAYCLMRSPWKRVTQTTIPDADAFAMSEDGRALVTADINGNIQERQIGVGRSLQDSAAIAVAASDLLPPSENPSLAPVLPVRVLAYSPGSSYVVVGMNGSGADLGNKGYCDPGEVCGGIALISRYPATAPGSAPGNERVVARIRTGAVSHALFSRDGSQLAVVSAKDDRGQGARVRVFDLDEVVRHRSFDQPTFDNDGVDDDVAKLATGSGPRAFVYITSHDQVFRLGRDDGVWQHARLRYPECEIASMFAAGASHDVLAQASRTCVFRQGQDDRALLIDGGNVAYAALRDNDRLLITAVLGKANYADIVIRDLVRPEDSFVLPRALEDTGGCGRAASHSASCENFDARIQASADGRTIAIKSTTTPEVTVYRVEESEASAKRPRVYRGDVVFSADDKHFATLERVAPEAAGFYEYRVYETELQGSPSATTGAQPAQPRRIRLSSPAAQAILTGIDRTGTLFAVQDPTGAQTTIFNVAGPEPKLAASIEGASFIPSFGGFKVIVRDGDGNANACELYRLESPTVPVWQYKGALVSCDVSDDGQVAIVASSNEAGRITLRVQRTTDGAGREPATLDLAPEARYMVAGDASKFVFVAVPETAANGANPPARKSRITIHAFQDGKLARTGEYVAPVAAEDFAARVFELDPEGETFIAMDGGARASVRKIKDPHEARNLRIGSFDASGRYGIASVGERPVAADGNDAVSKLGLEAGTWVDVGPHRRLALAKQRNHVAIHDLKTLSKFADIPFPVQRADFSPDGSHLVVRTPEGTWLLPLEVERLKSLMERNRAGDKLSSAEECRFERRGTACD